MSQVLVDIGGTSIRLGWQSQKAEDVRDPVTYACRDFATPVDALRQYCDQNQLKVDTDPPTWFYEEFLVPLGFDRMVMDIPEVQCVLKM